MKFIHISIIYCPVFHLPLDTIFVKIKITANVICIQSFSKFIQLAQVFINTLFFTDVKKFYYILVIKFVRSEFKLSPVM